MPGDTALHDHVGMLPVAWQPRNPSAPIPSLSPGRVHLWAADLSVSEERLHRNLTDADRHRGERIADEGKRRLYLGGRAGMRLLLSAYTGIAATEIRFGYGPRGKPVLLNETPGPVPLFNYTLSRDKVLYALSVDRELGVDMEALPRRTAATRMAARKLTRAERIAWRALPAALGNDAMLCCWTRKEAYGKALGVGIRYHLGRVTLFADPAASRFRTPVQGLFDDTDYGDMPSALEGIQLGMPFAAVAALMYPAADDGTGPGADAAQPGIVASLLDME